jgi:hypothetical protein
MYVAPNPPHFNDVPATNAFYAYVETAYGHWAMRPVSTGVFGVGNSVTRGDIAYGLFTVTTREREFTHNGLYAGSNNYEHPYTPACNNPTPAPGGYQSVVRGNESGFTQNYGVYSNYGVIGREISFDSDAKQYLSCVANYRVGIVFHAYDNPGGDGNCQNGNWNGNNFATNLPDPIRGWSKNACWWGDSSEYRIRTSAPGSLQVDSPQYFVYHAWTPTDDHLQVEINIDNYQLNPNDDPVDNAKDNMQKFCYKRTQSGQGTPEAKYGTFPCP